MLKHLILSVVAVVSLAPSVQAEWRWKFWESPGVSKAEEAKAPDTRTKEQLVNQLLSMESKTDFLRDLRSAAKKEASKKGLQNLLLSSEGWVDNYVYLWDKEGWNLLVGYKRALYLQEFTEEELRVMADKRPKSNALLAKQVEMHERVLKYVEWIGARFGKEAARMEADKAI